MMPSPHNISEPRRIETRRNSPCESPLEDGPCFAEWISPLQTGGDRPGPAEAILSVQAAKDVGGTSSVRQSNGAASKTGREQLEADAASNGAGDDGSNRESDNEKTNDNSLLSSIMASCTTREKPKIFLDCDHAGLPLRELDRMARALHDSALTGRPKLSLGIVLPELGEIRFDVQISGKVVFIHAFVENERAASALALAISALRDRLEEHRLILGRLDVTSPGGKNQAGRPPGARPITGHRKKRGDTATAPGVDSSEEGIHVLA